MLYTEITIGGKELKVLTDFIPLIMYIFKNSGFFKIDETEVVETEKKL